MGDNSYKVIPLKRVFGNLPCVPQIENDMESIFNKGHTMPTRVYEAFILRSKYLEKYKGQCIQLDSKNYELLKNTNGLYSMRIKTGEYNIRVLFVFVAKNPLLLSVFWEKGKNDYKSFIERAQRRFKEVGHDFIE